MSPYRQFRTSKTALVLAGGGLTGAVYHVGALRAIDDLLVDRTVNDFDIFIGTSAGALISAMLANGMSPDRMLRVISGPGDDIDPIERKHIFSMDSRIWELGWKFPLKMMDVVYSYFNNRDMTLFDLLWMLFEAVPPGFYDGLALERYVRKMLMRQGMTNQFDALSKELHIIATDLDDGERVIFGTGQNQNPSISMAVAASSALPLVYKPVRLGGREYVDGGLRGTASIDLAIERGASLVVCINPLVPFNNIEGQMVPLQGRESYLSDHGVRSVADQVLRIISYSGLQYHVKQINRRHPSVDVILIEPRPDDRQMFFNNIMRYSARLVVAQHGFESVTMDLAEDYARYKRILSRHGIPITRRLVIEEMAEIFQSGYSTEIIRKVLEGRSSACARRRKDTPICNLTRSLSELEMMLEESQTEVY
jgi:NTE family protein